MKREIGIIILENASELFLIRKTKHKWIIPVSLSTVHPFIVKQVELVFHRIRKSTRQPRGRHRWWPITIEPPVVAGRIRISGRIIRSAKLINFSRVRDSIQSHVLIFIHGLVAILILGIGTIVPIDVLTDLSKVEMQNALITPCSYLKKL